MIPNMKNFDSMKKILLLISAVMTLLMVSCTKEVKSVSLDAYEVTLEVGQEYRLTAIIEPEKAENKGVAWTASPEGIVSVDENGTVKGLKPGVATVTATTLQGGFTAECKIFVNGLVADKSEITLQLGDNATINVNSTGDYNVTCSPENLVTVTKNSDGTLTISTTEEAGEGTLSITAADGSSTTDIKVTVVSKLEIFFPASYRMYTMYFAGGYIEMLSTRAVQWSINADADGLVGAIEARFATTTETKCGIHLGRYVDANGQDKDFKVVITAVDQYGFMASKELLVKSWTPVLYTKSSGEYEKVDPATFVYYSGNTLAISLHDSNNNQCPFIEWSYVTFSDNVWTRIDSECLSGYYDFDLSENLTRNDNYATMLVKNGIASPNITVKIGEYGQDIDFKGNVAKQ